MNTFFKTIIITIFVVAFFWYLIVDSVMDLTNAKDVHEVNLDAAVELLVVENSINYIIPIGKEYYYLGVNEQAEEFYIIQAEKRWLDKHFDANGIAPAGGVLVKGLAEQASDSSVRGELANRLNQLITTTGYHSNLKQGDVIDTHYVREAVVRLVIGVVIIAISIALAAVYFRKNKKEENNE